MCMQKHQQISFWVICQMFPPPKLYTLVYTRFTNCSYYHLWRGLMTPLLSVCSTALFQPHPMTISAGYLSNKTCSCCCCPCHNVFCCCVCCCVVCSCWVSCVSLTISSSSCWSTTIGSLVCLCTSEACVSIQPLLLRYTVAYSVMVALQTSRGTSLWPPSAY